MAYGRLCIFVAMILCFSHMTQAQVPFPKQCPKVDAMENFELEPYMGVWYEYTKYPFFFEVGKKCMYSIYDILDNRTVNVVNAAVNRFTGRLSNVTGKARLIGPARLTVKFKSSLKALNYPSSLDSPTPNYEILGTDYTSYSVVYSCADFTTAAHTKLLWVLTRERKPSDDTVRAIKRVMRRNHLSQTFLIDTDHDDCPEAYVPSTNKSLIDETTQAEEDSLDDAGAMNTLPNMLKKV